MVIFVPWETRIKKIESTSGLGQAGRGLRRAWRIPALTLGHRGHGHGVPTCAGRETVVGGVRVCPHHPQDGNSPTFRIPPTRQTQQTRGDRAAALGASRGRSPRRFPQSPSHSRSSPELSPPRSFWVWGRLLLHLPEMAVWNECCADDDDGSLRCHPGGACHPLEGQDVRAAPPHGHPRVTREGPSASAQAGSARVRPGPGPAGWGSGPRGLSGLKSATWGGQPPTVRTPMPAAASQSILVTAAGT